MGGRYQATPLAADSPMGSAISSFAFNLNLPIDSGVKIISALHALHIALTTYALSLFTVALLGLVLYLLAPLMYGQRNFRQAMRTAIYGSAPGWIAAVCLVVPALIVIFVIGTIYSLYIMQGRGPCSFECHRKRSCGIDRHDSILFIATVAGHRLLCICTRFQHLAPVSPSGPVCISRRLAKSSL
jgi:Yip1 domain